MPVRPPYRLAAASRTAPPAPPSGYANPRCYASPLQDCSSKISREHYISKDVLEALGGTVSVSGLAFLEVEKSLPAQALTAKILCDRHNSALSPLDAEAGRFFRIIREIDAGLRKSVQKPSADEFVVNGADVERWCLKALAGLALGGTISSERLKPGSPWLEVLFGQRMWPTGWGLHLHPRDDLQYAFAGLEIAVLTNPADGSVLGGSFDVGGIRVLLSLGRTEQPMFQPAGVHFRREGTRATKTLTLSWPHPAGHSYVGMTRVGQYDGPRPID